MVTNGLKTKLQTNVTELTSCVIKSAVFSYVCAYFYQSLKQSRYAREEGIVVQFPQWHLEIRICNNRSSIPNVNIRQESKQKRTQFRKKPFNQTCNNCNIFFCLLLLHLHAQDIACYIRLLTPQHMCDLNNTYTSFLQLICYRRLLYAVM